MRYLLTAVAFLLGLTLGSYWHLPTVKAQAGGTTVRVTVLRGKQMAKGDPTTVPGEPIGFSCAPEQGIIMDCYVLSK